MISTFQLRIQHAPEYKSSERLFYTEILLSSSPMVKYEQNWYGIERALLFTMQDIPLGEFYLSKSIYSAALELAFICLNEEKKKIGNSLWLQ